MPGLDVVKRALRRGRIELADHPACAPLLVRVTGGGKRRDLTAATELVIEGYPRSGNTFAVEAFRSAQHAPVNISSHVHTPAQLLRAISAGIPALLVIREPIAAATSLMLAAPYTSASGVLYEWIRFHRRLVPRLDEFVVATFDDVTTDMGAVIARINERYGTTFTSFQHDPTAEADVFAHIEAHNARLHGGEVSERDAARPSPVRAAQQGQVRERLLAPALADRRAEAGGLYEALAGHARGDHGRRDA